jgi:hypothetical protein
MKVLFDQNVARRLRSYLPGHEVRTSFEMGWSRLVNGQLLEAAENAGFEVFVTGDQSLAYQQNLSGRKIAIIELSKNNWPQVQPYAIEIADAVNGCVAGAYKIIFCSPSDGG